jgi:hypothetical protein
VCKKESCFPDTIRIAVSIKSATFEKACNNIKFLIYIFSLKSFNNRGFSTLKIFIPYDQENVLCISEFINYENEYYFDKEKIHCSIESLLIEIFGIIQNYIFRNIKDEENKLCEQLNLINIYLNIKNIYNPILETAPCFCQMTTSRVFIDMISFERWTCVRKKTNINISP